MESKIKITGGPNQKVIKDTVKSPCDAEHYYTTINNDALLTAALRLKGETFKVWLYFAKNVNGYSFALSSKHVCETFGISRSTYDRAIESLINAGYLREDPVFKNQYVFYDFPRVA